MSNEHEKPMESRWDNGGIISDASELAAFFKKNRDRIEKLLTFGEKLTDALGQNKVFRWLTGFKL